MPVDSYPKLGVVVYNPATTCAEKESNDAVLSKLACAFNFICDNAQIPKNVEQQSLNFSGTQLIITTPAGVAGADVYRLDISWNGMDAYEGLTWTRTNGLNSVTIDFTMPLDDCDIEISYWYNCPLDLGTCF